MSGPPLRVMLVDDHEVVRDGIKALLAAADDILVCPDAERAPPDVVVMDVRLPHRRLGDRGDPRHPRRPTPHRC